MLKVKNQGFKLNTVGAKLFFIFVLLIGAGGTFSFAYTYCYNVLPHSFGGVAWRGSIIGFISAVLIDVGCLVWFGAIRPQSETSGQLNTAVTMTWVLLAMSTLLTGLVFGINIVGLRDVSWLAEWLAVGGNVVIMVSACLNFICGFLWASYSADSQQSQLITEQEAKLFETVHKLQSDFQDSVLMELDSRMAQLKGGIVDSMAMLQVNDTANNMVSAMSQGRFKTLAEIDLKQLPMPETAKSGIVDSAPNLSGNKAEDIPFA